jgi:1,4-dihydroxy-2-naphthoyl-CoA hydrolase
MSEQKFDPDSMNQFGATSLPGYLGDACFANLPEGANSFTTIELKSNHLGTARDGAIACVARAAHMGRTTQVWDVVVTNETNGKTIALFRCTQMILFPK